MHPAKTRVAVIVPALNEEATVAGVVRRCYESLDPAIFDTAVVVIDDGSTDGTARAAEQAGSAVFSHDTNRGVGRAFQTGLEVCLARGAEIIVNIDADGQFRPEDIPLLVEPIVGDRADFVTASRFKDPALVPDMPCVKRWGNRLMSRLISRITGQRFHDVSCGFRAYSREAALRLNLWGDFTYTQESFLDLHVKGMRLEEVPVRVRGEREHGNSRVASNLVNYGYRTLKIILHSYRDFWPLHFFGFLSLGFIIPGLGLLVFLFWYRLGAGQFSPHIWSGFTGAGLVAIGILILTTGIMAEAVKRIRLNQEQLMYYHKKADHAASGAHGDA
jgi:glycosyltransferase involved in cell wall biosynthesis